MTGRSLGDSYFHCTDRERAAFEAGIKLGGIFHQFTGTPVSPASARSLEQGITEAVRSQPFVREVSVMIDRGILHERCGVVGRSNRKHNTGDASGGPPGERDPEQSEPQYEIGQGYTTLTGDLLVVRLTVQYHGVRAVCGMRFVPELEYPLMYVERIEMNGEGEGTGGAICRT